MIILILGREEQPWQPRQRARLLVRLVRIVARTRVLDLACATALIGVARC